MIGKLIKVAVVAVVLAGSGAGYWWYRRTERPIGEDHAPDESGTEEKSW